MEFKKLELTQDNASWAKRLIRSKHLRKSVLAVIIGALAGVLIFYFSEGTSLNEISSGDFINSALLGAFFGFFVTNSPCARGRC